MIYRALEGTVRQGDIFDGVPVVGAALLPLQIVGKPQVQKGGNVVSQVFGGKSGHPVPPAVADGRERGEAVVPVRLERGLLLSRGCDIDHAKTVQFAPVRPLSTAGGDAVKVAIIEGRAKSCHFLPADSTFGVQDCFVDFRQIATVKTEDVARLAPVVGLTRDGVRLLYPAFLRHLTAAELRLEGTCDSCGATVPLLSQIKNLLDPPEDY